MSTPDTLPTLNPAAVLEQEKTNAKVLEMLLDQKLARSDTLFAQVTEMAGTKSCIVRLTLQQTADLLRFAKDLGLFRTMFDKETGELIVDHNTIDEIQQRPLDYTRQLPLTIYLAGRKYHKFPPILAVMTADWVDRPDDFPDRWEVGFDGQMRAKDDSIVFSPLDSNGTVGLLMLIGYLYALDGQHRLLGIKGLTDLVRERRLIPKTKSGVPTKKENVLTIEELVANYNVNEARLNALLNETIAIEIIPAVKKGETREEARRRVKSVFTHVNKTAVRLTPGQIAQLEEDDGFALVAKYTAVHHDLLKDGGTRKDNPRVNWNTSTISNTSTVLTTLQTLTVMAEGYLIHEYAHWKSPVKDLIPVRPDDDELQDGEDSFGDLLTALSSLDSMQELDRGTTTRDYRLLKKEGGQAHLLFRPVGQIALASACGVLVFDQKMKIETIFNMLRDYEKAGGFAIDDPKFPWWGVVYDPIGQKIARGGELGAEKILTWLLGGTTDDTKKEELRQLLIERRTVSDGGSNDGKVVNFDGSYVDAADFKLPPMLT